MNIDMRKAALLLPVYIVLMLCADALFNSAGLNTKNDLPLWLTVAFTVMALAVFLIVSWFITQKIRGKISVKRERAYAGILIALVVSGFIDDALKGLASLIFDARSIWVMIPMYILSYVALLTVLVFALNKIASRPGEEAPPNPSTTR